MEVYVITISDVYEFVENYDLPLVFLSYEKALLELRELLESAIDIYADEDWEIDDEIDEHGYFEMYPDGQFGMSHYAARISKTTIN